MSTNAEAVWCAPPFGAHFWRVWLVFALLLVAPRLHAQPEPTPPPAEPGVEATTAGWVEAGTDALGPVLAVGEVIAGWTVSHVDAQAEFQRAFFTLDGATTGVEILRRPGEEQVTVQSAPEMSPPEELLVAVTARAASIDWTGIDRLGGELVADVRSDDQDVEVHRLQEWPNPVRRTWPFLLVVFLAIVGVEASHAFRAAPRAFAHWTRKDTLFCMAVSVGIVLACRDYPLLHDAVSDLQLGLMVAADASLSRGVTSSVGLAQGALWAHLLGFGFRWGFGLQAIPVLLITLHITVLALWWRRLTELSNARGMLAWFVIVVHVMLILGSIITRLQHDVLLWPAAVLFALALDRAVQTGRLTAFALAAFAFAFCMEAHFSAVQFAPILLAAALLACRRPVIGAALVIGIVGWTECLISLRTLQLFMALLPSPQLAGLGIAAGVVGVALGARVARRRGVDPRAGVATAVGLLLGLTALASLVIVASVPVRYYLLALPLLSVFGPLQRLPRASSKHRIIMSVVLALLCFKLVPLDRNRSARPRAWMLSDAVALEPVLVSFGNYTDLLTRLRAPNRTPLLVATGHASASATSNATPGTVFELLRVPDTTVVPPRWTRVRLRGRMDAFYRVQPSALPAATMQVCLDGVCHLAPELSALATPNLDGAIVMSMAEHQWYEVDVTPGLPPVDVVPIPQEWTRIPPCVPVVIDADRPERLNETLRLDGAVEHVRFEFRDSCLYGRIRMPNWVELNADDQPIAAALALQLRLLREREMLHYRGEP